MRIRYFAWLKQRTGCAEEELDLPAGVLTVADLGQYLASPLYAGQRPKPK